MVIPKTLAVAVIEDYHKQYGHMGPVKVIKAVSEHFYIKSVNKMARLIIRTCAVCQMVKVNNSKKDWKLIPIITYNKLEKIFIDMYGPFLQSGGRHQYKYISIIFYHHSKFAKLYPINPATTKNILDIISEKYIVEVGKLPSIITNHGTQFRAKSWKDQLKQKGIKAYKTSIYHPSSNTAD